MISELNKCDFYRCNRLIDDKGQLEVKAVIEGINPGRIFVDNITSPKSGLVWLGNNDGFFFIGNEENEVFTNQINNFIDTVIKADAKKVGLNWFEGMGNHPKWNMVIEKMFEHCKLRNWNQRVYMLQKEGYLATNEPYLDEEYIVKKISRTLYENKSSEINNIEFLHSKILDSWASPVEFFDKGIGYCIVYNNNIISVCYSVFAVENVHSVAIETLEDYRGKKLAQKIAHSFVNYCLEKDKLPYWDCMEDNKPSIAIAENLGFTNVFNYEGYYFPFN